MDLALATNSELKLEELVGKLRIHEHMLRHDGSLNVTMSGEQVAVCLEALYRIHTILVRQIADEKNSEQSRQAAYEKAYVIETTYDFIMKQLKLYGPLRSDAH